MKKVTLLIILAVLAVASLRAQSPCYNAAIAEGKRLYEAKSYAQAKKYFNDAKDCPDSNMDAINEWIKKCNERLKEQEEKKQEKEAASNAYMQIQKIDYCNVAANGQMIDDYGAALYPSRMKNLLPRITYNGLAKENKNVNLFIKVYNPNDILVTGKNSPSGYTYSASIQVLPGKDKTVLLPVWDNNGLSYSTGSYKFELWYNDKRLFSSKFVIVEDPTVTQPDSQPTIVYNAEKKAEIKVYDKNGLPLEGAKLLFVGTGKYERTNSDGVGRIDMEDRDRKKIEVSHPSYKDKKEIEVKVGDVQTVWLTRPKTKENSGFNVAHYVIPGLGQMKAGKTGEGIITLGGEVLLVAGGVATNFMAKNQLEIMKSDNVSVADFQKAKTNYKVERTVNIACYSSAALLYVVHLCRSISLGSKYKSGNLTFAPAVMNTGNEMAFGMNINLTF